MLFVVPIDGGKGSTFEFTIHSDLNLENHDIVNLDMEARVMEAGNNRGMWDQEGVL